MVRNIAFRIAVSPTEEGWNGEQRLTLAAITTLWKSSTIVAARCVDLRGAFDEQWRQRLRIRHHACVMAIPLNVITVLSAKSERRAGGGARYARPEIPHHSSPRSTYGLVDLQFIHFVIQ